MPTRGCGSPPRRYAKPPPSLSDGQPTPGVPRTVGPSTCSSCDASGSWSRSRNTTLARQRAGTAPFPVRDSLDPDAEHRILVAVSAVGRRARTWPCGSTDCRGRARSNGDGRMAAPRNAGLRCAAVFGAAFTRPAGRRRRLADHGACPADARHLDRLGRSRGGDRRVRPWRGRAPRRGRIIPTTLTRLAPRLNANNTGVRAWVSCSPPAKVPGDGAGVAGHHLGAAPARGLLDGGS